MLTSKRLLWQVGLAYAVTWLAISWLTSPALDPYGDMIENYAWSQTLAWGSFKHPPLFAWMVRAWFTVFPTRVWAYYLLSYVNAGAGLAGILFLARLCLPGEVTADRRDAFLAVVVVLAVLSAPYSNLAAKFNADTVQLSLWPWTAFAFFAALTARERTRQWLFTLLLGATGAAAMLGKYYSALLLITLFIVSISDARYRQWYRTVRPYAALVVFIALLVPHAVWEARLDFPFRHYYDTKFDAAVNPGRVAVFLLSAIYYFPLSWTAWLILRTRFTTAAHAPIVWTIPTRALVLLAMLPAIITCSFSVFARVHLTTHWAIPSWFALPIVMAAWLFPRLAEPFPWRRLTRGLMIFWVALAGVGLTYSAVLAATGNPKYSLARPQMVAAIEARFAARFPGRRLSWAAGSWPESAALAFFGAGHPRGLPGFPDESRALVNPFPEWRETYGVIICYPWGTLGREGSHDAECEAATRAWLQTHALPTLEDTLPYRAQGWRFPRAEPKNVTTFWVPPTTADSALSEAGAAR
jgi:4-amino-4-deoxy-L-arabinose transferase-like glycosyltransferase